MIRGGTLAVVLGLGTVGVTAPAGTSPDPDSTPPPRVVLRDPGDTPREPLRWVIPAQGTARKTTVTMEFALSGNAVPSGLEPLEMVLETETTVLGLTPEGAATVAGRVVSVRSPNQPDADAALAPLGDLAWESDVTTDGRVLATRAEIPEGLDPTTESTLEQVLPQIQQATRPFPIEPVGESAKWRVIEELEVNGVPLTQQTDHRLERRNGNEIEVSVRMRQTAERGPIDVPGVPPGAQVVVRKWRLRGSGSQVLDLTRPFDPVESEVDAHSLQRLRVSSEGETETITIEIDFAVSFEG